MNYLPAVHWVFHVIRRCCFGLGIMALGMAALAFTSVPFYVHRWLGTAGGLCSHPPQAIIVLSGSGMPSGPELMRCDLAARWAARAPEARLLLLLPLDTGLARAMAAELGLKGVAADRIDLMLHGRNTREQALDAAAAFPDLMAQPVALVTAPENMYRSLLAFRKIGFRSISGAPTFDHALFDDLQYGHGHVGGKPYIPDVSGSMAVRYDFWNRLKLEITCLREFSALTYYRLNGWL